jgi:hypothetical protein
MNARDWNDPRILEKGKQFAEEAHNLASELEYYGADAAQLLLSYKEQDTSRPPTATIPTMLLDALQALLMSLPRPSLNGGRHRDWSPRLVGLMIEKGASVNGAAQAEALRTTWTGGDIDAKARGIAREARKLGIVVEARKRRAEKKKSGGTTSFPSGET